MIYANNNNDSQRKITKNNTMSEILASNRN